MRDDAQYGSRDIAAAAIKVSVTGTLEEEKAIIHVYEDMGILIAAANFGGEFIPSINKMIERAIVAAKRENVIGETHHEEGAVAGAAREALSQIMSKAIGLNVGGKIAVARCGEHIGVAIFFGIGLLHLNEVAIGLGHRVI